MNLLRAYYASKLSENISQTPEGYLICKNVPIARTGSQEYLASELNLEGVPPDNLVAVYRSEDEVFNPAAIASFEGKPLTDDHPSGNVNPDNICRLLKGVCNNVRRGQGEDSDKVVADLVAYDPILIGEIIGGKRGISCGYDCDYEFDDAGKIHQRNIRGNHVAVVSAGRAGNEVVIHDNAPNIPKQVIITPKKERRTKRMSKLKGKGFNLGRLFPMFAKDADPEAVAEVMEELAEALTPTPADTDTVAAAAPPQAEPKDQTPTDSEVPPWAQALIADVSAIKDQLAKPTDADPLDKLEAELTGSEEAVTVPAAQLGDCDQNDNGLSADIEPSAEDEDPNGTGSGATDTRATVLAAIRAFKPVVASIKDTKQRRAVSDSLDKMLRASLGVRPGTSTGAYSAIIDAKQNTSKHATHDAKTDQRTQRAETLGKDLADKFNPHYKKKG